MTEGHSTAPVNDALAKKIITVFGEFDDFYRNMSAHSTMSRHGVVSTPLPPHRSTVQSSNRSPPLQQATKDCLQKMQELVPSLPLERLDRPSSAKKVEQQQPVARSVNNDNNNQSDDKDLKSRKRREMRDDDEETSRKRERKAKEPHGEEQRPGPSSTVPCQEDKMRELFGDDNDEVEKTGTSPDSGVHSTENNDPDENDILPLALRHMVSSFQVSSPLSPLGEEMSWKINNRPPESTADKEKKNVLREDRDQSNKKLREQQQQVDKQNAAKKAPSLLKDPKKEPSSSTSSFKPKIIAKLSKFNVERPLSPPAERPPITVKEEPPRMAIPEIVTTSPPSTGTSPKNGFEHRIRGELFLQALSQSKMNKLMDIGKKYGTVKKESSPTPSVKSDKSDKSEKHKKKDKKDREKKRPSSDQQQQQQADKQQQIDKQQQQRDKEKRLEELPKQQQQVDKQQQQQLEESRHLEEKLKETIREKELKHESLRNDVISTPPRPSSSQSTAHSTPGKDFRCASNECIPSRPAKPEKCPPDYNATKAADFYQTIAKDYKRKGDRETDPFQRIIHYLESVVYFSLSAKYLPNSDHPQRYMVVLRDTLDLMKVVTGSFYTKENLSNLAHHFMARIRILSLRAQAMLSYNLYSARSQHTYKTFNVLDQMLSGVKIESRPDSVTPELSDVPSTSTSTTSGETVVMPVQVYNVQKSQLKSLHYLMWAHRFWDDAAVLASKSSTETSFINSLESICGHLCMDANVDKFSMFLLTALSWLRNEYELEKKRPQPPPPQKSHK